MPERLELMAQELEQSGEYRVLRRLQPQDVYQPRSDGEAFTGIILDTETTGLDVTSAEVIELGMIKFAYAPDGAVFRVVDVFNQLQQPSAPIPAEITRVTGITDAMVAGHSIDAGAIERFVAGCSLVIAHNARFDRPMCEKTWRLFEALNWACSVDQIPWLEAGFEGARLGYLLNDYGLFHNGHRASDDCRALLHLLASPLHGTEGSALATLLQNARQASIRLWAKDSPFEAKDLLKARGYRWADGSNGSHRSWWIDVREDALNAELEYLRTDIFKRANINPPTARMTARERYSIRVAA